MAKVNLILGQFDWQNLIFMNIHKAEETNLLPMKSHVTIKNFINNGIILGFFTLNRNQHTCVLENSLMEPAVLNSKPNLRYKM